MPHDATTRARIGERLRVARSSAGLSQDRAATQVGIARTTLIAIEQGSRDVRPEELSSLARLYNVKVSNLLREPAVHVEFAPQFRRSASPPAEDVEGVEAYQTLQRLVQSVVELETRLGRPLRKDYPSAFDLRLGSLEVIAADAADVLRTRLGIGSSPLVELPTLLESELGVRVFVHPLPSRVSGAYAYHEATGACIVLNAKHPARRRRWTLAHELGHFMSTRTEPEVNEFDGQSTSPAERFADRFAGEFLLPARVMRARCEELMRSRGRIPAREVLFMARQFRVSYEAMCRRLEALGLVEKGTWEKWRRQGLTTEKIDKELGVDADVQFDAQPPRLLMLAVDAYTRDWLTETQFASFLSVDVVRARELIDCYADEIFDTIEASSG